MMEQQVTNLSPRRRQANQLEALAPLVAMHNEGRLRRHDVW